MYDCALPPDGVPKPYVHVWSEEDDLADIGINTKNRSQGRLTAYPVSLKLTCRDQLIKLLGWQYRHAGHRRAWYDAACATGFKAGAAGCACQRQSREQSA